MEIGDQFWKHQFASSRPSPALGEALSLLLNVALVTRIFVTHLSSNTFSLPRRLLQRIEKS